MARPGTARPLNLAIVVALVALAFGFEAIDLPAEERRKFRQILESFQDEPMDQEHPKYVCAPCSNCKGQYRDLITYYDLWDNHRILYGGLVELIVNAMVDVNPGFIKWEDAM